MEGKRILELLKIERECVRRNSNNECDRNCAKCDLVQKDADLLEMYDILIKRYGEEEERKIWVAKCLKQSSNRLLRKREN